MSNAPQDKTLTDRAYAVLGMLIPSCTAGLRLVELGQQRPLKLHERLALVYNSPLCLHCSCKRDKFDKERAKLRAMEKERRR
jgi:hypothetical protein